MEELSTADLWDEFGDRLELVEPLFKSFGAKPSFHGAITTIKCHEDNSLVRETLGEKVQGKVLVIDGGGSLRRALVGDRLAQKGIDNGWEGILVFGCIRDSKIINQMDIGIRALNTVPAKTVKRGVGLKDVQVKFGGVSFVPGHFIYVDEDGIVVSKEALF